MQNEDTSRPQWSREKIAELVTTFAAAAPSCRSVRGFARAHEVPRSTLQHWLGWLDRTVAPAAVVAFFESPDGLAVLHRFVVAVQFVMGTMCGCGVDAVSKVFELAGLDGFVANSHGSRHKVAREIEQAVCAFAREERERLSRDMQPKSITVCEDETFHPQPCLVAIEPVSNFILLEKYTEGRDADTWNRSLAEGLQGLAVDVIQSTSDEGQGLLCHVRKGLGAHHSPDIFHVQQELSRATSAVLASAVRRAEDALVKAEAVTQTSRQLAADYGRVSHGRGRPPDFEARIARGRAVEQQAAEAVEQAKTRQQRSRRAIRGIGEAYHPVDPSTGELRTALQTRRALEQQFDEIAVVAAEARVPDRCIKSIQKARRLLPALVATMAFFWSQTHRLVATLNLSETDASILQNKLLPMVYLHRLIRKARNAAQREALRAVRDSLADDVALFLQRLGAQTEGTVRLVAEQCADLFQRSSSCVEGRNGQLSLRHHSLHNISPRRLEALKGIHNYFIRRSDNTTAAERFFGAEQRDMFPFLLDHVHLPARPRNRRRSPTPTVLH